MNFCLCPKWAMEFARTADRKQGTLVEESHTDGGIGVGILNARNDCIMSNLVSHSVIT